MKNVLLKNFVCLVCVAIILSAFSAYSFSVQNEKEIGEKYTYLDSYKGTIDHGIIKTTVSVKVIGKTNVTSIKIKMELQKLSSGSYSTVETWEQVFSGTQAYYSEDKVTNPLSTYRIKATVTAYAGSAYEQKVFYVNEN